MDISWTASFSGSAHRMRDRTTLAALLVMVAGALAPSGAGAQDPNLVDQGRFDVRLGDRAVGSETFAVRRQGDGYMAVGRIQLEGSGTWLRSAEVLLSTDGNFAPVRYRHESTGAGEPRSIAFGRTGTRIRITVTDPEGDRVSELLARPGHVLLGPGIAQHYYFLVRRLATGAQENLTALIPGEGREAPVRVVESSDASVEIGDSSVAARRWELDIGGATHLVWADPSDGRILRVEIPDRDWRSIRRAEE